MLHASSGGLVCATRRKRITRARAVTSMLTKQPIGLASKQPCILIDAGSRTRIQLPVCGAGTPTVAHWKHFAGATNVDRHTSVRSKTSRRVLKAGPALREATGELITSAVHNTNLY